MDYIKFLILMTNIYCFSFFTYKIGVLYSGCYYLFDIRIDLTCKDKKPLIYRGYKNKRETGLEPAASTLARSRSTN